MQLINKDDVAWFITSHHITEAEEPNGIAQIHKAAMYGNLEVLNALILKGEDINRPDASQKTPLHYAALRGQLGATQALLEQGADPNAVDAYKSTPLHMAGASRSNTGAVVAALITGGADPELVNMHGGRAIETAVYNQNQSAIQALLEAADHAQRKRLLAVVDTAHNSRKRRI
ncbi:ankyrin repeat domain-containing protein [Pseudoxanthomonas winnipegensis]|uniref:Ankyrin repeat domain-containing protein n=1 Tax=Pseudoxanthomonas winnipegensis TaxID=2480810 RepID=A0A4Q8M2I7_9GAMM|nr:ankyrin repeat domain-containing protein [Pseudoxanthomonas winnipegensis]TAA41558.1 ankyrin repeat domain-containing protein [Pseudoxanthomonas winnipegensis]